jgi:hypothetical protein
MLTKNCFVTFILRWNSFYNTSFLLQENGSVYKKYDAEIFYIKYSNFFSLKNIVNSHALSSEETTWKLSKCGNCVVLLWTLANWICRAEIPLHFTLFHETIHTFWGCVLIKALKNCKFLNVKVDLKQNSESLHFERWWTSVYLISGSHLGNFFPDPIPTFQSVLVRFRNCLCSLGADKKGPDATWSGSAILNQTHICNACVGGINTYLKYPSRKCE